MENIDNNLYTGFNGFEPQKPFTENFSANSNEQSIEFQNEINQVPIVSECENNTSEEQLENIATSSFSESEISADTDKEDDEIAESSDNPQFMDNGFQQPQYNNDYSNPTYRSNMQGSGYGYQGYGYPQGGNVYRQYNNYPNSGAYPQQPYQPQPQQSYQPQYQQHPQQPYQQPPQYQPHPQQPYQPPQYRPRYQQQMQYPQYQQPAQPVNYSGNGVPYAEVPIFPKKKTNGGVIAIIVILIVLMLGSLIGLIAYVTYNNVNNSPDNSNNFGFTTPYDGNGGFGNFNIPENDTESKVHEDSDYSSKTQSDYEGMQLNSKPYDADSNSQYNAGYASGELSESIVGIVCYSDEITSVKNADAQGSGIVLTSDGYILTNAHVIDNSRTNYLIQVVTSDGKSHKAGVVGFDTRTDLAVLKIDNISDLKPATFGDSDETETGEDIIVAANPGGLKFQNTITKGVVSALNREISSTSLVRYMQTDAAINPGSSGGAVANLYGQVIGVATLKIADESYEGMAFAIPSRTAKEISDSIIRNSYVKGRVKIGIIGTAIGDVSQYSNDEYPDGIIITNIVSGGPCDGTALKQYDIITKADGQEIDSFTDMYEILEQHKAGDKIKLEYYRYSDKSTGTVEIILQEDK